MTPDHDDLLRLVKDAIGKFNEKERYLIKNDLSERCICARFAMVLENTMLNSVLPEGYCVDVEYNRGYDGHERSQKRIDDKLIVPDLIVHKRGYDCNYGFDNLICIEMKKSTNNRGIPGDEERLNKMTSPEYGFCYKLGAMIIIDMKTKQMKIKRTFPEWQTA